MLQYAQRWITNGWGGTLVLVCEPCVGGCGARTWWHMVLGSHVVQRWLGTGTTPSKRVLGLDGPNPYSLLLHGAQFFGHAAVQLGHANPDVYPDVRAIGFGDVYNNSVYSTGFPCCRLTVLRKWQWHCLFRSSNGSSRLAYSTRKSLSCYVESPSPALRTMLHVVQGGQAVHCTAAWHLIIVFHKVVLPLGLPAQTDVGGPIWMGHSPLWWMVQSEGCRASGPCRGIPDQP